jgi:hypothetical protein
VFNHESHTPRGSVRKLAHAQCLNRWSREMPYRRNIDWNRGGKRPALVELQSSP